MSRTTNPIQPRGPHGSLERRPLEDRDVRLARVRPRRLRPRRNGRHEDDRPEHRRSAASPAAWTGSSTRASSGRPTRASSSRAARSQATDPAFTAAIEDVVARISKLDVVQNVRSPLDEANAGQISENGRAALVEFEIRGDGRRGCGQDRPGPRPGRRCAAGPPAVLHRRVRVRERGRRGRDGVRGRPREGRPPVAPDHA